MKVKDIMVRDVYTIKQDRRVEECAKLLLDKGVNGFPVLDDKNKIVGIITEGDLIKRASRIEGPSYLEILGGIIYFKSPKDLMKEVEDSMGYLVREIMTNNPKLIDQDEDIDKAASLMVKNSIKTLPVVDKSHNLVGIITRKDIMEEIFQ